MTSRGFPSALSARTRRGLVLFWSALFILSLALQYVVLAAPAAVLAVHDEGLFELDGNAVTTHGAGLPDDWDRVYGGTTTNAINSLFINDGFGAGDDIFTGGSTKDDINLPSWLWKVGSVQDKNDIENAFAVAYEKNGSTYAYFGLDRYQTSGDATAGFWFFKNAVGKTGNGTGNGSPFSGTHAEGDILVVLDYSNGGSTASAQVYYWHNGALTSLATGTKCGSSSNDAVCAIANTATATAPWPYDDKAAAGSTNPFPANALFEGGLNLTTLGLDTGCFSSFMAETRSSNTTSSTLSDFALGGFSFCKQPTISTSLTSGQTTGPKITVAAGSSVTDQATLSGATSTAGGTVSYKVYTDSSCTAQFADAGTKTVTNGSVPASNAVSFPNPGTYYWQAAYSGDARNLAVTSTCTDETVTVPNPSIAITKDPPSQTILSGGTATWTIVVTNTGDVALTDVNVTDPLAADCVKTFDGSLAVGASEPAYSCSLSNVTADFTNVATAHGTPPVGPEVTGSDSADVHVTPLGSLVITKTVTGVLTGFDGGDFTFSVVCSDDVTRPDVVLHVVSGSASSDPIIGIPDGTTCTVTETDKPAAGTYASWDDPTYDPEGGVVTIVGSQQVTVTVTNNRTYNPPQPAHLTLVKVVDNTGGGQASKEDWTLTASNDGQVVLSGSGGASGDVPAGTYDLAESSGPDNYTAGRWNCDGGSQEGSSVTLAEGESATCTITNTYNPPPPGTGTIIIEKRTVPSGSSQAFTFDSNFSDGSFSLTDGETATFSDLAPGSYDVSEIDIPTGWSLAGVASASDDGQCVLGAPPVLEDVSAAVVQSAYLIELEAGQTVHCIFTNTQPSVPQSGALKITKVVAPTDGFDGGFFTFTYVCGPVSGTATVGYTLGSDMNWTIIGGLPVGVTCTVTETGTPPAGGGASWGTPTYAGNGGLVPLSGTVEIVVTNPRILPTPTPSPTPSGSVEAVTATPRITLPPTDSIDGANSSGPGLNLGLILLVLAGISAVLGLMVPVPARIRRRGRRR